MRPLLLIGLLLIGTAAFGQGMDFDREESRPMRKEQKPRGKFRDNLILGGNFGLQFGSVTFVDISPLAGYQVFKNAFLGIGVTYQYLEWQVDRANRFSTHTYGGRVFGRYIIWKGIMAHAEFEMLNLHCWDPLRGELRRTWVPGALFGGGYFQGIGGRSGFTMLILFNALQSDCTPYANPVFRLGFNFGI